MLVIRDVPSVLFFFWFTKCENDLQGKPCLGLQIFVPHKHDLCIQVTGVLEETKGVVIPLALSDKVTSLPFFFPLRQVFQTAVLFRLVWSSRHRLKLLVSCDLFFFLSALFLSSSSSCGEVFSKFCFHNTPGGLAEASLQYLFYVVHPSL